MMRNDDIAENVLQIGKEGVRQNIAEALNEFCEEFADEMWKAAEEVIKLRAENAALRERLEKAVELPRIIHPNETEWHIQYQNEYGIIHSGIRFSKEAAETRLAELKGETK